MTQISVRSLQVGGGGPYSVVVDAYPDSCPTCKRGGRPELANAASDGRPGDYFTAIFVCPFASCRTFYRAEYIFPPGGHSQSPYILAQSGSLHEFSEPKEFSEHVRKISPQFQKIYNQAAKAEASGLDEICGPGFRRALEILVKDFILNHEMKLDEEARKSDEGKGRLKQVLAAPLSDCIKDHISDERIRKAAIRATWIGNDETHYVRKWEDKDLADLRRLIEMTVSWIDLVITSEQYESDMPDPPKPVRAT